MRYIQTGDSLINMDLISRFNIIEETPTRVCILADGDKLYELRSRWEADSLLERIIDFSQNGNGVFDPVAD